MGKTIKQQKWVLTILLSNIFIAFLGIGLVIPVMPSFMNIMHLSGKTMGYLVAVFAVAQLLMSPIAGRWVAEISAHTTQTNFVSDLKKSVNPLYFTAFIIVFVLAFGLSAYETVFSLFSDHKFGFTPKDIAGIITISSIFGVVVQVFLFGKMVDLLGEKKLIQICLFSGAILAVASTMIASYFAVLAVTCLIFLAFDLLRPALTTFLSRAAGKEQGFVAGMNSTYTSLGNIVGPAMGGILFDVNINYPYLFAAVIMVIGLGITFVWKEKTLAEGVTE
ncbi:MFS transporter [Brevibacillus panacihumi]|nr:MFS transporter [Brevibacillus panacihumi]